MFLWWLGGAGLLALLSILPRRTREGTVCRIGRICLGIGLIGMVGLPLGSVINTLVPGGLSLTAGFFIGKLDAIALPLITAGLAISLGRMIRWSFDAVRGKDVPEKQETPAES